MSHRNQHKLSSLPYGDDPVLAHHHRGDNRTRRDDETEIESHVFNRKPLCCMDRSDLNRA